MMYGKHFTSMYSGSMVGAGAVVFAVWGYVIANQVPDRLMGSQVRLNSVLLGVILGEKAEAVEKAIKFLCSPDPRSQSKEKKGCRLVKVGEFDYQVVNGAKYLAIRNEEERRVQNREAQRRHRNAKLLPGEAGYIAAERRGAGSEELERIVEGSLPENAATEELGGKDEGLRGSEGVGDEGEESAHEELHNLERGGA